MLDAYPWKSPADREFAVREAEMVSFGEEVVVSDLPLAVRQWARRRKERGNRFEWHGESWNEALDGLKRALLEQALEKAGGGGLAAAARLLGTTPRVVSYAARRLGVRARD